MDLSDFLRYSAKLGSNPLHIQGAGGNTSMKSNSMMWIKASGESLSNSLSKNVFVQLDLSKSNSKIGDWHIVDNHLVDNQLRPSIETTMHACLPFKYVIHAHSINIIAYSICMELRTKLSGLLDAFSWSFIPYFKPGTELASHVKDAYDKNGSNIFILQNHGVVIAGESISQIYDDLLEIDSLLTLPKRMNLKPDMVRLKSLSDRLPNSFLPSNENIHTLAMDTNSFNLIKFNPPSPDHVVF